MWNFVDCIFFLMQHYAPFIGSDFKWSNDVVGSFVVDVGMDWLNVADSFAYASAIELSFTSICRKQKNIMK